MGVLEAIAVRGLEYYYWQHSIKWELLAFAGTEVNNALVLQVLPQINIEKLIYFYSPAQEVRS